jgi:hypothetical protein
MLCANPFDVASGPEIDTHKLAGSNEQGDLYGEAIVERGFFSA